MAVSTTNAVSGPYVANGVTTSFPFTFKALNAKELLVTLTVDNVETEVPPSEFSAIIDTSGSGGAVVFGAAPASGDLRIYSNPLFTQEAVFASGQRFSPTAVNDALDRAAVRDQYLLRKIDDAVLDANLPLATEEAAETGASNEDRMSSLRVKQAIEAQSGNVKANAAALGVDPVAANMGATPGSILTPDGTVKQWFQEVEAAHESEVPLTQSVSGSRELTKQLISNAGAGNFTAPHLSDVQHNQSIPFDYATQNVNRASGISGGAIGSGNYTVRAMNYVYNSGPYNTYTNPLGRGAPGAYDGISYENALGAFLYNGRIHVDGAGHAGMNCAFVAAGLKMHADAGSTWGLNALVKEFPGSAKSTLTVAAEFDVHADGDDINNARLGVTSIMKSLSSADGAPSGFGEGYTSFWATADEGVNAYSSGSWFSRWKRGYVATGPMDVAFDASGITNDSATVPFGVNAIAFRMSRSSRISFDRADGRRLGLDSSNLLKYDTPSGLAMSIDDNGNFSLGSAGPVAVANTVAAQVYRASGDAMLVAKAGSIDTRMISAGSLGAAVIGTYSNHAALLFHNGAERARLSSTGIDMAGVMGLKAYTLATVPTALTGGLIYISNLTGGAEPCFSDGTNWRRCSDRAVAS